MTEGEPSMPDVVYSEHKLAQHAATFHRDGYTLLRGVFADDLKVSSPTASAATCS